MNNNALTTIASSPAQVEEYRTQPYNLMAEQALLGAILVNNEMMDRVGDFLTAEHFYEPVHQRIYAAVIVFKDRGVIATPVTLKNFFDKDEALASMGGAEYLGRLAGRATTIINIADYGKVVYDLAIRRKLIVVGGDIVNSAFETEMELTAVQQIEQAEQVLFTLASEGKSDNGLTMLHVSLQNAVKRAELAYKHKEKVSGIPTKFDDLDNLLGGLQNSDLLILAGRPSMGKTALAINMAFNACQALYSQAKKEEISGSLPGVGFFSLEMSSEQLASRILAMVSGVNSAKMRTGQINESEFFEIIRASSSLKEMPFFMDDTPALTISALRTRARRLQRKHNVKLIMVDYLQLLRGSSSNGTNRVQEVSEITQGLKAIAKELNIPVIALSQLSRAVEQREDKRPQLSDLRESGSIEQDADIVMFIYREEYYLERKQPQEGTAEHTTWQQDMDRVMNVTEVIIAKQRHGPIGTVKLQFDANTTKFSNLARETR